MKTGIDYIGVGVGVFIQNDKGEVLLMKRGHMAKNEIGTWIIPGGTVNFGETLAEAIIRETKEEIGVDIELNTQLPVQDHILKEENQHWITTVFSARITNGTPKVMEPGKCDEVAWFPLNNLPSPIAKASQGALKYFSTYGK